MATGDDLSALSMLLGMNQVQAPDGMGLYAKRFIPKATDLNFEKRVLNPSDYPVLRDGADIATHKMAWSEGDKGFMAYPTVVQDGNRLKELSPEQAWLHANQTGEFRQFDTPFEAEQYSKGGYKNQWGDNEKSSYLQQLQRLTSQGTK